MRDLLRLLAGAMGAAVLCVASASGQTSLRPVKASVTPRIEFNDHIEFGISVDPSTVSTSRTSPQLKGSLRTLTTALEADGALGAFEFSGSLAPTLTTRARTASWTSSTASACR